MIVKFDDTEYLLDTDEIDLNQATFIKVKTGLALRPWQEAISDADPEALKCLYWLMREQNGSRVVYEKINIKVVKFYAAFADANKAEQEEQAAKAAAEEDKLDPTE
jgi:hypothetical protein